MNAPAGTSFGLSSAQSDQSQPPEDRLQMLLSVLDQTYDAFVVRDSEDSICFWNKGAERLYGWRADEAIGKNVYSLLFPPEHTDQEEQSVALTRTGHWAGQMCQITKSGRHIFVESRWTLQRDLSGYVQSMVMVNHDITEKKMLERQILCAQRAESVATIAGAIAHDLNNVLPALLVLMRELPLERIDSKRRADLESLQFQAEQAARLITELLSFTRDRREDFATVDLVRLIAETARVLKRAFPKMIQIRTVIPEGLRTVTGNVTHLYQAVLNLCLNARDAMPSGGILTIGASNVDLNEVDAARWLDARPGSYVRVTVSDNGCGIPDDIVDRIFEPLFTTKDFGKGSGLGLFSVARIVKNHKGFLDFSSEAERGTEFSIYLVT